MFQTTLDNLNLIYKQQSDDDYKAFMQECMEQISLYCDSPGAT